MRLRSKPTTEPAVLRKATLLRRGLRPLGGEYAEPPSALNPVCIEIRTIHSENRGQRFPFRQINEGGVGEVHRMIPVSRHQITYMRQLRILEGRQHDRPGTDQFPSCLHVRAAVANEMKQLGQDGFGCYQRKPEPAKCLDAGGMPTILSVKESQNGTCVDEAITGHGDGADAPEWLAVRFPHAEGCGPR